MKYKKIRKKILVTGGSGYIGSVLALQLYKNKNKIIILDKKKNPFINNKNILFLKCDLANYKKFYSIIKKVNPDIVIHLAAQSTLDMINKKNLYVRNNTIVTENLIKAIKSSNVSKLIFSSTASVYKQKNKSILEYDYKLPNNIYGKTKLDCEKMIIKNLNSSKIKFCILRFFNVCSSYKELKIGEYHMPETHLLPITINSLFNNNKIKIYGKNYKTKDGTCIRDYIHIKDIVSGIIKSIKYLESNKSNIFNLGSGKGFSVMDIIKLSIKIAKIKTEIKFEKKRAKDVGTLVCNIKKAKKLLKWSPVYSNLKNIIKDEIWWFKYLQSKNKLRKFIY